MTPSKEVAEKIISGAVPAIDLMDSIRPLAEDYISAIAELDCVRTIVRHENPIIPGIYRSAADDFAELIREKNNEIARLQTVVDQHNDTIDQLRAALHDLYDLSRAEGEGMVQLGDPANPDGGSC